MALNNQQPKFVHADPATPEGREVIVKNLKQWIDTVGRSLHMAIQQATMLGGLPLLDSVGKPRDPNRASNLVREIYETLAFVMVRLQPLSDAAYAYCFMLANYNPRTTPPTPPCEACNVHPKEARKEAPPETRRDRPGEAA